MCEKHANPLETDEFFHCTVCQGIFRSREYHLPPEQEKKRYLEHDNDVHDAGYRQFVLPITSDILRTYERSAYGLDFGAGPGPVISEVLQEQGYNIIKYDPFFSPDTSPLAAMYDFIVCCEVIEHFFSPSSETGRPIVLHDASL